MSWNGFINQHFDEQKKDIKKLQDSLDESSWLGNLKGRFVKPEDWETEKLMDFGPKNIWRLRRTKANDRTRIILMRGRMSMEKLLTYHEGFYWLIMGKEKNGMTQTAYAYGFPAYEQPQVELYLYMDVNDRIQYRPLPERRQGENEGYEGVENNMKRFMEDFSDMGLEEIGENLDTQVCWPMLRLGEDRRINWTISFLKFTPDIEYTINGYTFMGNKKNPITINYRSEQSDFEIAGGDKWHHFDHFGAFTLTPDLNFKEHPDYWKRSPNSVGEAIDFYPYKDIGKNWEQVAAQFVRDNTFLGKIAHEPNEIGVVDVSDAKWLKTKHPIFERFMGDKPLKKGEPLTSDYLNSRVKEIVLDTYEYSVFVPENPIEMFSSTGVLNKRRL